MKAFSAALLAGVASAAIAPQQQPLQLPKSFPAKAKNILDTQIHHLKDALHGLTDEAAAIWDEVAALYPEDMSAASFFSLPKKHTRRPDHEWDHIVRGSDVQNVWVENANGEQERYIDGKLDTYDLRVKKVDPSELSVDPGVKQYSGYLDDNENDKHLFYWFFESRNDPKNDPVVLWLNGGPGCSSLTGLFLELGPSRINEKLQLVANPYSWNDNASVIFLDQPVNVGYSYSSSSVSNTVAAGKDVYALLTLFFEQFPEYSEQDFHIAGESYAGHYIPVFTSEILSHKKTNINIKSVLIGNGLTDGYTQYPEYRPMACGDGGWPAVLDEQACEAMDNALPRCQSLIENCYNSESVWSCVPASIYCNNALLAPYQRTGQNVYDVRGKCKDSSNLCYPELGWISKWLNEKSVMKALGVEVDGYDSCNFDINRNFLFQGDWMQPFHRLVPGIIEKLPVLIYAGDADFICNWLGNKAWAEALEYPDHKKFAAAEMEDLRLDGNGRKIGEIKSHGNFTFMRIHAAGHMVPLDQPEASLEFFNRWLAKEWF